MRHGSLCVLMIVALATVPAQAASNKCQLQKIGELPVTMRGTQPLIAGTINGIDALFIADSGAFFSMLSVQSAQKYNLRLGKLPDWLRVGGTGGIDNGARLGTAKDFSLAGLGGSRIVHNIDFVVSS